MPENRLYQKLTFLNKLKDQPVPDGAVPLDANTLNALSQAIYDIETELIQVKNALAAIQEGGSNESSSDIELIEGGEFAGILKRIVRTGMKGPDDEPLPPIDISKIGVTARELGGSPLPLDSNSSMMEAGIYCYDEDTDETLYLFDVMDELEDTLSNTDVMQALSDYLSNSEDPSEITVSQIRAFFDNYNEENDLGLRPVQIKCISSFLWVNMQIDYTDENDSDEPEYMEMLSLINRSGLSLTYGAQISMLGEIVVDKLFRNASSGVLDKNEMQRLSTIQSRVRSAIDSNSLSDLMDVMTDGDLTQYLVATSFIINAGNKYMSILYKKPLERISDLRAEPQRGTISFDAITQMLVAPRFDFARFNKTNMNFDLAAHDPDSYILQDYDLRVMLFTCQRENLDDLKSPNIPLCTANIVYDRSNTEYDDFTFGDITSSKYFSTMNLSTYSELSEAVFSYSSDIWESQIRKVYVNAKDGRSRVVVLNKNSGAYVRIGAILLRGDEYNLLKENYSFWKTILLVDEKHYPIAWSKNIYFINDEEDRFDVAYTESN